MGPQEIIICAACVAPRDSSWLRKQLRNRADLTIGVDRGVSHLLQAGVVPDIGVGDWDSLRDARAPMGLRVDLPRAKNYSDFALALAFALSLNPRIVRVFGTLGGRKDHEILALEDVRFLLRKSETCVQVVTPRERFDFYRVGVRARTIQLKGTYFSLWTEGGYRYELRGAKYSLSGVKLEVPSHALSNEANCVQVRIRAIAEKRGGHSASTVAFIYRNSGAANLARDRLNR